MMMRNRSLGKVVFCIELSDCRPAKVVVVVGALHALDLDAKTDSTRILFSVTNTENLFKCLGSNSKDEFAG